LLGEWNGKEKGERRLGPEDHFFSILPSIDVVMRTASSYFDVMRPTHRHF